MEMRMQCLGLRCLSKLLKRSHKITNKLITRSALTASLWEYNSKTLTSSTSYCSVKRTLSSLPFEYNVHTKFILSNTAISLDHLTPEIKLHLITPETKLWSSKEGECAVPDPFWAFYWPGGQALTRFILDHPELVRNKRVLDVGSGCGASAIAAAKCGADLVIANDICQVATAAIHLNAVLNNTEVLITTQNLIGYSIPEVDIVLLGDMFYDTEFATTVAAWLSKFQARGKTVLVGDPGRLSFQLHPIKRKLQLLATYDLPESAKDENYGMTEGFVWGSNHKLKLTI